MKGEETREEAVRRYLDGQSSREVAKDLDVAHTSVLAWVRKSEGKVRPKGVSTERAVHYDSVLSIRVSSEEMQMVREFASDMGLSLSSALRQMIQERFGAEDNEEH